MPSLFKIAVAVNQPLARTFFNKLPPALPPFCQLLCIRLLYACPLVDAVHQVITQPVAVVDPLHHPLVVTDLATRKRRER